MSEKVQCPRCNQGLTQVGQFWVCPEHGQVALEKAFSPMRIFLSYGHDDNEDLIRLIKASLEKRCHDVWFDKNEIKGGHDWRRSITEGIIDSNRVLSFLSNYSTRDPGVCLDEIAIAIGVKGGNIQTILVENEQDVKPPPSISHIQWLDMHDWKERRSADDAAWESWYQEKLAEIVAVVESDESRRFAGEIQLLEEYLKPILPDSRIFQLLKKGLVGRAWLVDAIEQWRNDSDRSSRLFWVMGAPGVGKSAFAAHLAHYGRDKVIGVQFCEYDKPDHHNPHRIVRTLAFQIATRLPDYRKLLLALPEITELNRKNPAELFDYLLAGPLCRAIDGGRVRYLIVIDALDEAAESERNPLVELLARDAIRLPDWIGIVVTSRPESNVIAPLQGLNPFVLDAATESNRADIRDYLRHELASQLQNRSDTDLLVEQILEKSEGVFLYVERFCDDVHQGHISLDHSEQFPQGLGEIFFHYFKRQFGNLEKFRKDVRPVLRAVLAAREPLPLEILQRLFTWKDEELRDFIRSLGSLFPTAIENGREVIKPYHKSLADWLADDSKAGPYFVNIAEGHLLLAEFGWSEYQKGARKMSSYSIEHLHAHLMELDRIEALLILVTNQEVGIIAKWVEGGEGDKGLICLIGLINFLEKNKRQPEIAVALATQVARIYSLRTEYEKSGEYLEYALRQARWWKDRRGRAIALHELGSLYLYRNENYKARVSYKRALRLCLWGVPAYHDEAAANLIGLATVANAMYHFSNAIRFANRAQQEAQKAGDIRHIIASKRLLSIACKYLGRRAEAISYLNDALLSCDKFEIHLEKGRLLLLKGWLQYDFSTSERESPAQAKECFKRASEQAQRARHIYCFLEAQIGLGWCALAEKVTPEAASLFKSLESSLPAGKNAELWAGLKVGLAAVIQQQGNLKAAENLYLDAISFCTQFNILTWACKALVGLGSVHWHMGESERATNYWRQSIQVAERISLSVKELTEISIDLCRFDNRHPPR